MRKGLVALLLVVGAGAASYAPVFLDPGSTRFTYDDARFVWQNQAVHHLDRVASYFTNPRTAAPDTWGGLYRPMRTLDFAIDYAISGGRAWWFHLTSLLVHIASSLLVYVLFRNWGAPWIGGLLGALVFAVHPVQVEAVAWITSRGDELCLFFCLAALVLHWRSRGYDVSFVASLLFLALALFSKEEAAIFPGAAFLADFFFRDGRSLRRSLRRWPKYASLLAVCVGFVGLWLYMQYSYGGLPSKIAAWWGGSYLNDVLTMAKGFVYYAKLVFVPVGLANDYYIAPSQGPDVLSLLCLAGVILALAWALRRAFTRGGPASFAILWSALTILPASNLVTPIAIPTADRFLYVPMVGISFWAGTVLARFFRRGAAARALCAALLVCLIAGSAARSDVWTSDQKFWNAANGHYASPRSDDWRAKSAWVEGRRIAAPIPDLTDQGRFKKAKALSRKAKERYEFALRLYDREIKLWRRLLPSDHYLVESTQASKARVLFYLGKLGDEGSFRRALAILKPVLAKRPHLAEALYARALALYGLGRLRAAARAMRVTLDALERIGHGSSPLARDVHMDGAAVYERLAQQYNDDTSFGPQGDRAQAFLALQRSWELLPDDARDSHQGILLSIRQISKEFQEKEQSLRSDCRRHPEDARAWLNLATLYAEFGSYDKSAHIFSQLLSKKQLGRVPQVLYPFARYQWEWRDDETGYERAIALYREIQRESPGYLDVKERIAHCESRLEQIRGDEL